MSATRMIAIAAAGLTLLLASPETAEAQRYTNYPVCAVYGFRTVSCAFNTMAQCYATVSGRGGFCELNDAYQPPVRAKRARKS
ncbi:MAG: DUF3551 domain-containing protein [Xanthobacteraceae bacterium]